MSSSSVNQAIESGNREFLKECMGRNDPKLFQADSNGLFPVHYACAFGDSEVLEYIIQHSTEAPSAIFGHKTVNSGTTPLHYAARNGHLDVVQTLAKGGADVNARDCKGWTPLHYACFRGFADVAELLITSGADVSAHTEDESRYTPLHFACYSGYSQVIFLLVKSGADLTEADSKGEFPLDMLPVAAPQHPTAQTVALTSPSSIVAAAAATAALFSAGTLGGANSSHSSRRSSRHNAAASQGATAAAGGSGSGADSSPLQKTLSELLGESYRDFKKDMNAFSIGDNALYSDVSVVAEASGAHLKAHKAILAARSPKLASELSEAAQDCARVSIPAVYTETAVRMFLEWCYTGDITLPAAPAPDSIKACAQLIDMAQVYAAQPQQSSSAAQCECGACAACTLGGLPGLAIAYLASRMRTKNDVMAVADAILAAKPSPWIGKLGAVMIERALTLPAVDSLVYVYQSLKKLPLDLLEIVISNVRLTRREQAHPQASLLGDAEASNVPSGTASPAIGPTAQAGASPSQQGASGAPVAAPSLVPELFVLEYAKLCPPEFKRKIKGTDNKVGYAYNYLLGRGNIDTCCGIINSLRVMQNATWFEDPVSDAPGYAPNYYNIVKHPMDFSTLEVISAHGTVLIVVSFSIFVLLIAIENGERERGCHCRRICDPWKADMAELPHVQPETDGPVLCGEDTWDEI